METLRRDSGDALAVTYRRTNFPQHLHVGVKKSMIPDLSRDCPPFRVDRLAPGHMNYLRNVLIRARLLVMLDHVLHARKWAQPKVATVDARRLLDDAPKPIM
jgi:hypothetical protein